MKPSRRYNHTYVAYCPNCKREVMSRRRTGVARVGFKCDYCSVPWTMSTNHTRGKVGTYNDN